MRCKQCKTKIGKGESFCPSCGAPVAKRKKWPIALVIATASLFLGALAAVLAIGNTSFGSSGSSESSETPQISFTSESEEYSDSIYLADPEEDHIVKGENSPTGYIDNELIVFVDESVSQSQLEDLLADIGAEIVGYLYAVDIYQVRFNEARSYDQLQELCEQLEQIEGIERASINRIVALETTDITSDPVWDEEGLKTWGLEAINASEAWDLVQGSSSVVVGVYDQGFYEDHDDLSFKEVFFNQNAEREGSLDHGTHVSGIIAALANDEGSVGVAYGVQLVGASYMGAASTSLSMIGALVYLVSEQDARVISTSLGMYWLTVSASIGNTKGEEDLEELAGEISATVKALINRGYDFVICKSAGNLGNQLTVDAEGSSEAYVRIDEEDDKEGYGCVPYTDDYKEIWEKYSDLSDRIIFAPSAEYDVLGYIEDEVVKERIIIVGAAQIDSDEQISMASYSSSGERVDLLAPGSNIYSTLAYYQSSPGENGCTSSVVESSTAGSHYGCMSGTSMATPMVAGVAALLYSANPDLTGSEVKEIIVSTASGSYDDINEDCTHALLDAEAAVAKALQTSSTGSNVTVSTETDSREIALVLDVSSSMSGEPLDETKLAAMAFVDTAAESDAEISLISYNNDAEVLESLTSSVARLKTAIVDFSASGNTNIESGLAAAKSELLQKPSSQKAIVLMSDGEPNNGLVGDELIDFAESIRDPDGDGYDDVTIFALGFNESSSGESLLRAIASEGCYISVQDADDLEYFFEDMADHLNGTRFMYIRIACPVDVSVELNGETLSSAGDDSQTRTSFGSLTFEQAEEESLSGDDDTVKVLRLREGESYTISITGTGTGTMTYTIGFVDDEGRYTDFRTFSDIEITTQTLIETTAEVSDTTRLSVDADGDGFFDEVYQAGANEEGVLLDNSFIVRSTMVVFFLVVCAGMALAISLRVRRIRRNKAAEYSKAA